MQILPGYNGPQKENSDEAGQTLIVLRIQLRSSTSCKAFKLLSTPLEVNTFN